MPREHELYRPILEDILQYSGGRRVLAMKEVCEFTGRENRWVKKHLGVTREGITAHELARRMAKGVKT